MSSCQGRGGRRVDSPLRHGAGSLHIKDDLQGATVFDIWLRFSLACVLCGTTCKSKWAASDHLKRSDINDGHDTCSRSNQSRRTPVQRATSNGIAVAPSNAFGTISYAWIFVRDGQRMSSWITGVGARGLRGRTVESA